MCACCVCDRESKKGKQHGWVRDDSGGEKAKEYTVIMEELQMKSRKRSDGATDENTKEGHTRHRENRKREDK